MTGASGRGRTDIPRLKRAVLLPLSYERKASEAIIELMLNPAILEQLDQQIAQLQEARAILATLVKRRPGRPKGVTVIPVKPGAKTAKKAA